MSIARYCYRKSFVRPSVSMSVCLSVRRWRWGTETVLVGLVQKYLSSSLEQVQALGYYVNSTVCVMWLCGYIFIGEPSEDNINQQLLWAATSCTMNCFSSVLSSVGLFKPRSRWEKWWISYDSRQCQSWAHSMMNLWLVFLAEYQLIYHSHILFRVCMHDLLCVTASVQISSGPWSAEYLESAEKLRIFRRRYIVGTLRNISISISTTYSLMTLPLTPKHITLNGHFALNSVLRRCVWTSEAWISKLGYS